MVTCEECDKPRCLHSAKKLSKKEFVDLQRALEDISYTCGATIQDFVENHEENPDHILLKVHARKDLQCQTPVEVPYYSSGIYPLLCCHCATSEELVSGEAARDIYATCSVCFDSKPRLLKRKRKLFPKGGDDSDE